VSNLLRLLELPARSACWWKPGAGDGPRPRAADAGAAGRDRARAPGRGNGWSVREVEHRVQQLLAGKDGRGEAKAKPVKAKPQADIATLERELSESLSTRSTCCTAAAARAAW
jgi:ParB family chromosome partitioning protein